MRISIVTISFNQAKFLEEAIRSVIDQDHPDLEYIVVDPGSTDGSREVINRYRGRIAKTIFEPDQGPADGLNKGFAHAHGDIFGFLNADDLLEPHALTGIASYFERHPDVDVVAGHSWIINEDGSHRRRFYSDRYTVKMAAYGATVLSQASTFFRAEAYGRTRGFNTENRTCWDAELFLDMAQAGARFGVAHEFWSCFRIHAAGISGSGRLNARYENDSRRLAIKAMGHEPRSVDRLIAWGARLLRKIKNPLDTLERLRYGSVSGR